MVNVPPVVPAEDGVSELARRDTPDPKDTALEYTPSVLPGEETDLAEIDRWPSPLDIANQDGANFDPPTMPEPNGSNEGDTGAAPQKHPLGAPGQFESLPDLDAVEVRVPRGVTPPVVAAYDLLFQLKHGLHPFVSPAADEKLRGVQVPLVTSTSAYRRAWRSVSQGRLPVADDLRSEEFLAALNNFYPPAAVGSVAISVAGGPAPLRDPGLSLLHVAVEAGGLAAADHAATHLTIVLDTSAGMRRAERWAAVQKALEGLRGSMGPNDRISLIGYNEGGELLVDAVDHTSAGRLTDALKDIVLQDITPRRAANLAAGLTLACTQASAAIEPAPAASAVLVISSGRVDSDTAAAAEACQRAAALVKTGLKLQAIDLGRDQAGESNLATWTQAIDGRLIRTADPSLLPWQVLEALIGRSPVVAARTSLRVTFKPEAVASYRLLGHERTTITGPSLAQTIVDLRCGESAGALFEIWLKQGAESDVGTAEVVWHTSEHSPELRVAQRLSREQFAGTFADSAPSLQAAAVAALTAETLRGSYYAPASRSLAEVIKLARQASPVLQADASYRELMAFMQQAERVRTHGGGSQRRSGTGR